MAEITKDFIKFVSEVILLFVIFAVVFGEQGIASNTFYYLTYIEPIVLQNWLISSVTLGSSSPGYFTITTKTTGQPHTIRIFTQDETKHIVVIPPQETFLKSKFSSIEPTPLVSECEIKDQEIRLARNIVQTITVEKVENETGCKINFLTSGILESEGGSQYSTDLPMVYASTTEETVTSELIVGLEWEDTSSYSSSEATESLDDMSSETSSDVVVIDMDVGEGSPVSPVYSMEDEYIAAFEKAKNKGYKIIARIKHKAATNVPPHEFMPDDVDVWFNSYGDSVSYWAELAEQYDVKILSIGSEFNRLEGTSYRNRWIDVIYKTKTVYSGELYYETKFWETYNEFNEKFYSSWFRDLDYVGVSSYWPLSNDAGASKEELIDGWRGYVGSSDISDSDLVDQIKRLGEQHSKDVIITTGLSSAEGACTDPSKNDWPPGTLVDLEGQKNWYEATLDVFGNEPWVAGILFDDAWQTNSTMSDNPDNLDFTIQGKPTQNIIKNYLESTQAMCDSQCKAQEFASGRCREKIDEELNELELKFYAMASYFKNISSETVAELYDMCQAFWWDETRIRDVKQKNPEFKALFYRNMRSVSPVARYDEDMFPMAVKKDWLLKNSSGGNITDNIWGLYAIDIGNSEYQNEVANLIKEGIDEYGYDGVFCDNSLRISAEVEWQSLSSKPINPRTGTYWTDAEVYQASVELYKAIRNAIGPKLIAGNGIARGRVFYNNETEYIKFLSEAKIDGVMSELMWYQYHGKWMSEQDWLKSLDMLVWFQDNFLKQYPDRIFTAATKLQRADGLQYPLPPGCTKEQMTTYAFASSLLGIKTNQNYLLLLADANFTIEFIKPLSNIVIGTPLSEYYMIESTHVYARDFTKVKVLVNPSTSSYTVDLDGEYKTLDGNTVSSITMQPHTGGILLKAVVTTTGGCEEGETLIEDSCDSGLACCCSGTQIDTSWFRDIRAFGLWAYGTLEMERETLTQQDYNNMKSWGINTVSSAIKIGRVFQRDTSNWNQVKLTNIKKHIEYAQNAGMNIILAPQTTDNNGSEWFKHDDLHQQNYEDLFYEIHEKIYNDLTSQYPNVIQSVLYFPFHKKSGLTSSDRNLYENTIVPNVVQLLRNKGYNRIIGISWVQAKPDAKELTTDSNVFYGYTNYEPGSVSHRGGVYDGNIETLRTRDLTAYNFRTSTGRKVFAFEWGVNWNHQTGLRNDQIDYVCDMNSVHDQYNIPHAYWDYSAVDYFGVLNNDGTTSEVVDVLKGVGCGSVSSDSLKVMRFTIHNNFNFSYTPDSIDHRNDGNYISQRTDMHQSGWMDAPCDTLRNNGIHCLAYFNVRGISLNINPNTENWRLKTADGNYITDNGGINFMVDPMNEEFRAWAKERVQDWKNMGYTGVWLDNGIDQDIKTHVKNSMTGHPVNPRTGILYEDDVWRNDRVDFANWLQDQFPDMMMVANALWNGGTYANHVDDYDYIFNNLKIDGLFSEGTFTGVNPAPIWVEYTWKRSIEMIEAIQDKWLSNPDKFFVWYSQVPNAVRDNVEATSRDQMAKYIFASVLMGVSKNEQNYVETHNHMADADTQALYNADIGVPLGNYKIISGSHVYERNFTKAKILVNPSKAVYIIDLDDEYETIDGEVVSSISLPPYTGEILLRTTPDELSEVDVKKYVAYNSKFYWGGNNYYEDYSGCWDMMQMHYEPAVVGDRPNQIKQADSNIEILLYRNTRAVYSREPEELKLFRDNGWLLKTASGKEIVSSVFDSNYMVDKGNPDYQEWFADWMKRNVETYGYDGVFLDNSLFGTSENMWYTEDTDGCDAQGACPPINPRTGVTWTNDDWLEADVGLINKVKEKIGDKPVILNGVSNGRKFFSSRHNNYKQVMQRTNTDGFIIELWMNDGTGNFYSEDDWKKSVDMIVWIEENLPNADKIITVGTAWLDIPASISNEEFATYSHASLLLGVSSNRYYMLQTPGGANLTEYCKPAIQSLHDIDIGIPLADYYISSGTRVYVRDFSKGKVLVNPTYTTYIVNLDKAYQTIDGQTVPGQLTVKPHTGIILKS